MTPALSTDPFLSRPDMNQTPTDPIVVARFTKTGQLSGSLPFSELFKSVSDQLGLDKVYALLPGGSGFSLKELGTLSLTFTPFTEEPAPPPSPALQYAEEAQYLDPASVKPLESTISPQPIPQPVRRAKRTPRAKPVRQEAISGANVSSIMDAPSLPPSPAAPERSVGEMKRGRLEVAGVIPASKAVAEECSLVGKITGY